MCLNKKLQTPGAQQQQQQQQQQHLVNQLMPSAKPVASRKMVRARAVGGTATRQGSCQRPRLNQLWSVWYCSGTLAFQVFLIVRSIQRFLKYIALPWPAKDQPYLELNAYVGFVGASVVLLPFFVVSSLLRVGNYPNDGCKIGVDRSGSRPGSSCIYQNLKGRPRCLRWLRTLWRHGGPTAPLLHAACAFCLLLPNVLIQAQLIKHGFLPKGDVWRTDLDFVLPHRDRLVVLGFLSPPGLNRSDVLMSRDLQERRPRDIHLNEASAFLRHPDQGGHAMSLEFVNCVLALGVHAVRYPAVFWNAHKGFAFLFSLQLGLDAAQKIVAFAGFTVLYKVHVVGARETLASQSSPLLLGVPMTLLLFMLYNGVLTLTGSSLYLYGLQKYREWRQRRLRRSHVTWLEDRKRLWGYLPHLSALLVLLMAAIVAGPLMYDYTLVYCGSLDGAMLAGVTGTVAHLFLWILLWLALTVKTRWTFVRGSGRFNPDYHTVHPPPAALQTALDSSSSVAGAKKGQDAPLLVIDNGLTYQVRETNSKQAILGLAQKDQPQPAKKQETPDGNDEDIYWLKPKSPSPKDKEATGASAGDRLTWLKRKSPGPSRHKVTFEDKSSAGASGTTNSPCKRTRSKSPKTSAMASSGQRTLMRKTRNKGDHSDSASEDGDYATLREMVLARDETDDEGLEASKPLFKNGRPVNHRRLLSDDGDYELLVDESHCLSPQMVSVVVHNGEPAGGLTPKFDSASESSTSPVKGGSDSSSSGCHSLQCAETKRCSSVENLIPRVGNIPWKSLSLQRNTPAPGETYFPSGYVSVPRTFKEDVYYDPRDSTLVIRRKREGRADGSGDTPFGRATNMRMTSFTDQPDFPNGNVLPGKLATSPKYNDVANRNALLSNGAGNGLYSKPLQLQQTAATYATHQRRDSANYSLNSSGESDTYMSHT